jgi:hypothetical protein
MVGSWTLVRSAGQEPAVAAAQTPTTFVLGHVIDAVTGRPIPGATVTIAGSGTSPVQGLDAAMGLTTRSVLTDGEGRFLYRNLSRNSYRFTASAPGYVNGAYGQQSPGGSPQTLAVDGDRPVGDATIRLWRAATIGGVVTDDSGGPVPDLRVSLLRKGASSG